MEDTKRKTHTSTEVKRRYNSKVYSRIYADLPKDLVARFKEVIKAKGVTTAVFFRQAMERVIAETDEEQPRA